MYNLGHLKLQIQYWQMLIKNLCARQLTTIITYSMELHKEPVVKYFDKNFKIARQQIQKIGTEFGMTKDQGRRLFHYYPLVFKPNSKEFESFKERVQSVKSIPVDKDPLQLRSVLNKLMFDSNHLTISMTKQQLDSFVEAVNKNFTSKSQVQKIFNKCPNLINSKFKYILQQKLSLLHDYLGFQKQKSMQIFEASPFLLSASTRKIRQSIIVLFRLYQLSKEQIGEQMKSMGEIFLLGGPVLRDIHETPTRWGLKKEQIKSIFLKNPLLFFNYPYNVMPKKRKILKYLNLTQPMGQKLFKQYPSVLISSIRSLQQKALFINNRLQIKLDINTVEVLTFNFNKILRPRGQLMVKSKTQYNNQNILNFLKMTNEQFVQKLGIPIQKLNDEIAKFNISEELDFRNNKVFRKIGTKQKIIKLASNYSH